MFRNIALLAVTIEANRDIDNRNTLFDRLENVKNVELFPEQSDPLHEVRFPRQQALGGLCMSCSSYRAA